MKDLLAPPRPVLSWPIFSYLFCFQLKPTVSSYILETDLVHDFVYQRFYQTEAKQFSFLKFVSVTFTGFFTFSSGNEQTLFHVLMSVPINQVYAIVILPAAKPLTLNFLLAIQNLSGK